MTTSVSIDDIVNHGQAVSVRQDDWRIIVQRIAGWLVIDGNVGRHVGRIEDTNVRAFADDALRAAPAGASFHWDLHPLARIDPLVTPGYILEFSTWRHSSYWTLKMVRLDDGRVRITESEQWLEGPLQVATVTAERTTTTEVTEHEARARAEQELAKLTPRVTYVGDPTPLDRITGGVLFSARNEAGWRLRIERVASWLIIENAKGRRTGRIDDLIDDARSALATTPSDAEIEWVDHPLASIDPLVTPGYVLRFSGQNPIGHWTVSFVRVDAGRVKRTETKEQMLDPDEAQLDEAAARAQIEEFLKGATPSVVRPD
jgi:hypothetical protein